MTSPLSRVLRRTGPSVLELLAGLPGADLTTLLLEVVRRRADRLAPADVLQRYQTDRFVVPGAVPYRVLRRAEDAALSALPDHVELLTCSPVVPLGTHSVLGTVHQNQVVSTIRGSEVAADPTNALALEAARRRRRHRDGCVRLATVQRVLRAQRFAAPAQPHFTLLALVSAGRDTGNLGFERQHVVEHLRILTGAARAAGHEAVQIRFTPLASEFDPVADAITTAFPDIEVVPQPDPRDGRGYYTGLSFKVYVRRAAGWYEVGDGGFVDWTRRLLADAKERLLTSGLGIDRLAT